VGLGDRKIVRSSSEIGVQMRPGKKRGPEVDKLRGRAQVKESEYPGEGEKKRKSTHSVITQKQESM